VITRDPIDGLDATASLAVTSRPVAAWPHLAGLLGGRRIVPARTSPAARGAAAVLGWGNGATGRLADRLARRLGVPALKLEDGFIRSVGLGKDGAPTVSVGIDDEGIYYDATLPSRLERLLASRRWHDRRLIEAGDRLWRLLTEQRLTKFNHLPDRRPPLGSGKRVLLVDQVRGDRSIAATGAHAGTFERMLAAALAERDAASLVVRTHPDVAAGRARGHLAGLARSAGVEVVDGSHNPHALLDIVDEVWTVSSQLGLDGLLRGKKVVCFGTPFYAGWRLTEDRPDAGHSATEGRRGVQRSIPELVAATFLLYCRYADPVSRRPIDAFAAAERIADWRRKRLAASAQVTVGVGFSRWKRDAAASFLAGDRVGVRFASPRRSQQIARSTNARVCAWGRRGGDALESACREAGVPFFRVEDGFIRSVGLGAALTRPGSLVIDGIGLHYDARRPSGIDALLASGRIDQAMRARARRLRNKILEQGMTKYNLEQSAAFDLRARAGARRVLLVAGQVPGDASLVLGAGDVRSNGDLIGAVREASPGAHVVYKRHPDLVAGHRRWGWAERQLDGLADRVVTQGSMAELSAMADEVHVISSLAGFEALLRGAKVVCWGWPFYAGRGLTDDRVPLPSARQHCTLDELVAAALILYPSYIDPVSGVPCEVEDYLEALAAQRREQARIERRSMVPQRLAPLGRWLAAG
jgi:capsular polysaccharide export protein